VRVRNGWLVGGIRTADCMAYRYRRREPKEKTIYTERYDSTIRDRLGAHTVAGISARARVKTAKNITV